MGPGFSWLLGPFKSRHALVVLLTIAVVVAAALIAIWAVNGGPDSSVTTKAAPAELSSAQVRVLLSSLTRYGVGPDDAEIDGVFGHPALLSALGHTEDSPDTLVFFLTENIHDEDFSLPASMAYLMIDGAGRTGHIDVELLNNDIHHRASKLTYSVPGADGLLTSPGQHTISLLVPGGQVESPANTLTWRLPVALPAGLEI